MFVRVAILTAAAVGAAAIVPAAAHAEVGFFPGLGVGGSAISSGPYDDCPLGTYQNKNGDCVERPDSNRSGATGQCCDGTDTHAEHRTGACSRHGGVCQWFAAGTTTSRSLQISATGPATRGLVCSMRPCRWDRSAIRGVHHSSPARVWGDGRGLPSRASQAAPS